jgi:uridylate kinase
MAKNPKRFLVKVSGEALMGDRSAGLDPATLERIAADLAKAAKTRQIAVVVGGGNIFRGLQGAKRGVERNTGDSMGRLATIINALALADAVRAAGAKAVALSADPMPSLCRSYNQPDADRYLSEGYVVVLGGGTGQPFFTTDTAAALRAAELDCAAVLKATNVDGVYTADPRKNPDATRYERLTHEAAWRHGYSRLCPCPRERIADNRVCDSGQRRHQQRACRQGQSHACGTCVKYLRVSERSNRHGGDI